MCFIFYLDNPTLTALFNQTLFYTGKFQSINVYWCFFSFKGKISTGIYD